jgi:hypothetical protein
MQRAITILFVVLLFGLSGLGTVSAEISLWGLRAGVNSSEIGVSSRLLQPYTLTEL